MVGCRIIWTSFYEDFITFSKPNLFGSTEKVVGALFKLLGWRFAEEGEKAHPFGLQCSALGVKFDLSRSQAGQASVLNTESRCSELCEGIKLVMEEGKSSTVRGHND